MAAPSDSSLSMLEAIFPDTDKQLLLEVLRQSKNDAQVAANKLLKMNSKKKPKETSTPQEPPLAPPPSSSSSSSQSQWPNFTSGRQSHETGPGSSGRGLISEAPVVKKLILIRGLPGSGKSTLAR
ncbi:PREDICTED: uncharacterized protein LOC109589832 [Amphimedon queenslandica]|uniref:CUE domain-containing protein n=1 Tax=Amphimedon queenslandica TaxID=400682 RepID=A0A1X7T4F4_AMPQE|nr:PREDICTED: uncharacterized protein LOC109589832 [Amphimedon queenslandica]|eukprot:XP_019861391.1 PREDICTED: uncharacterized protein LOC109589832 [Amphimedon queenslandica]